MSEHADLTNENAASEADVGTTHRLITEAINLGLEACVQRAKKQKKKAKKKKKLSEADFELNDKALSMGIKWCVHNRMRSRGVEDEQVADNVTELRKIQEEQRGKLSKRRA